MKSLTAKLIRSGCTLVDNVSKALSPEFSTVPHDLILGRVSRIVEKEHFAVVTGSEGLRVITRSDLLAFINTRIIREIEKLSQESRDSYSERFPVN